jgi:hypothetical protein
MEDDPAGRPDTARPVFRRGAGAVVMRFRPSGEIAVTGPSDPLLTGAEAAAFLRMQPGSWRSLVSRGIAPKADDPGDLEAHPRRRNPKWLRSSVARYRVDKLRRAKAKTSDEERG